MPSWKGKTRGGLIGYKIFIFILNRFGLSVVYFGLHFICFYFIFFAPTATKSSLSYFRKIHHQSFWKALLSVYRGYFVFAQTIIDKIAIASGKGGEFDFYYDGIEHLQEFRQTGGIIVSAHLGNWDIAGQLLDGIDLKTNVLVFEAEHENIKKYLDQVMSERKVNFIPMSNDLSHIFAINQALSNKELICMHGDRFTEGSRSAVKVFMGKNAQFPLGPFSIIARLKVPYSFAYAVRGKGKEYFLSATPIKKGEGSADQILEEYISHLEAKLEAYPLQWFNYYDFWASENK